MDKSEFLSFDGMSLLSHCCAYHNGDSKKVYLVPVIHLGNANYYQKLVEYIGNRPTIFEALKIVAKDQNTQGSIKSFEDFMELNASNTETFYNTYKKLLNRFYKKFFTKDIKELWKLVKREVENSDNKIKQIYEFSEKTRFAIQSFTPIQLYWAEIMNLTHQWIAIDYENDILNRSNWIHTDLDIEQIAEYMKKRDLSFLEPNKKSFYDRELWFQEEIKAYHTVFLFVSQLGFDPLTFIPLNDQIFKGKAVQRSDGRIMWTSDYIRHHLKRYGKESIMLQDLVLTDVSTHNYWNGVSETDAREILRRFSNLINMRRDITKNDVVKAFSGGYEWVLNNPKTGWFRDMNQFNDRLTEFNIRKGIYKSKNGIERLLLKSKSFNLINRFYQKVLDDKMRRLILFINPPYSGLRDYSDFFAIDFYLSKQL